MPSRKYRLLHLGKLDVEQICASKQDDDEWSNLCTPSAEQCVFSLQSYPLAEDIGSPHPKALRVCLPHGALWTTVSFADVLEIMESKVKTYFGLNSPSSNSLQMYLSRMVVNR
jgi:hypothetical protein